MPIPRAPRAASLLAALMLGLAGCGGPPRLAVDPLPLQDDDRYDVPMPRERERDDYYDVLDYTIYTQVEQMLDVPRQARHLAGKPKQALNVTPLDEVLDSTWWTNRIGTRRLTPAEVRQGPNDPVGPDTRGPWTIVRAKTQGVTPGFTIEDPSGARFVIKFDPRRRPELATGADAICTRLFWALGYNVPQNYIVHFDPDILRIGAGTRVRVRGGSRPMQPTDLQDILDRVPRDPDGRLRALASRFLPGRPLGPFAFAGRRRDDPNDVIPHEHRRELRAYRVFCSWVHHNDSREINTLDMFVEENGRHFVRHYLIDFGATLGSRSYDVNLNSEGHEYLVDFGEMMRSLLTLGLYKRPWVSHTYPNAAIRGVGKLSAAYFDPLRWKPDYPNPAFENLTLRDAFWAARRVMAFDDDLIRAAVESAEYSDPRATDAVTQVLIERRDRIGRAWFARLAPLDGFRVVASTRGAELRWRDLAVEAGFTAARPYAVEVRDPGGALQRVECPQPVLALPAALAGTGDTAAPVAAGNASTRAARGFGAEVAKARSGAAEAWRLRIGCRDAQGRDLPPVQLWLLPPRPGSPAARIVRIEHAS